VVLNYAKVNSPAAIDLHPPPRPAAPVTLFLCGDVMTGRGVDQILPHPGRPHLFEPYVRSAIDYVRLAEDRTGALETPVDFAYVWGEALAALERARPDARIINLETAVTAAEEPWPRKGIHYRMHPANVPCLAAARPDCCVLANNHVLDWGRSGLAETLEALHRAGLRTAGAGRNADEACAPARIDVAAKGRVLVFACAMESSGVPREWSAAPNRPGVCFLEDLSPRSVEAVSLRVRAEKRAGDVAVLSIHWGGNWGFRVSREERTFARHVIDAAGVDVVHGHSSHHVKGVEVYRDRPILYGCGDFLNDYEGIGGYEDFRSDLSLMYLPTLDAVTGRLLQFRLTPTQIRRFRVNRSPEEGVRWLLETLNREGKKLGTRVERQANDDLLVRWN
jgi:poly-gamma-glutamate capsule biosynthesis protein CapA/YwtB (metallophosphatase superfamily)